MTEERAAELRIRAGIVPAGGRPWPDPDGIGTLSVSDARALLEGAQSVVDVPAGAGSLRMLEMEAIAADLRVHRVRGETWRGWVAANVMHPPSGRGVRYSAYVLPAEAGKEMGSSNMMHRRLTSPSRE